MTAVLSASHGAGTSSSASTSPHPQTKAQSRPASTAMASDPPSSSPHLQSSQSSNFTPRPQHLSASAARIPSDNSLTRVRSRSRDSAPSRRHSRLSTHTVSTRPNSTMFPLLPSSLSYALVRDFAYPAFNPLHYGPQPHDAYAYAFATESGTSSPAYPYASDKRRYSDRRLSDPPPSWENNRGMWTAGPWGGDGGALFGISGGGAAGDQLPSTSFGYDSDDDKMEAGKLAKNHRKSKSFDVGDESTGSRSSRQRFSQMSSFSGNGKKHEQKKDLSHLGTGLDSQGFFTPGATDIDSGDDLELDHGVDAVTYLNQLPDAEDDHHPHHEWLQPEHHHGPLDESFAGPSLALYTFRPENANELALREGQIVEVGYRHGQGWLVAMDLETREQGLVPEEYVRLLSDIEGWPVEEEGEDDDEEGEEDLTLEHDEEDTETTGTMSSQYGDEESTTSNVGTTVDRRRDGGSQTPKSELPDRSREA